MKSIDIADTSMPASMEGDAGIELHRISSKSHGNQTPDKILSGTSTPVTPASYSEAGDDPSQELRIQPQGRPSDLPTMWSEVALVLLCSSAQLLFASFLGNMIVLQSVLLDKIHIKESQTPWIQGAFTLANGLAVIISGSLADLFPPKKMICAAFAWLVLWNIIGGVSLRIGSAGLFFVVRAMQGAAIGLLVATAISMLGRIYHPGRRKNRAFSAMASTAPLGFWVGTIQGGALSAHSTWIFWSNAMICAFLLAISIQALPNITAALPEHLRVLPRHKLFDYPGALLALLGSAFLVFGLTEGTPAQWAPYAIVTIVLGVVLLTVFVGVECRVSRPLVPMKLWKTPGFTALVSSYALGFGSYIAWQFYATRFFLDVQAVSPLTAGLYYLPNAIVGVLAAAVVSRVFHIFPAHWLFITAMVSFGLGPVFFLPQTSNTSYWALSMPGIALVTLGPDLSFAAASIFITSQVPRDSQGAAGSLLVTIQNLSAAIMTGISDAIGVAASGGSDTVSLKGLHALWWFQLASALCGAIICSLFVRIPRGQEKAHAQ